MVGREVVRVDVLVVDADGILLVAICTVLDHAAAFSS